MDNHSWKIPSFNIPTLLENTWKNTIFSLYIVYKNLYNWPSQLKTTFLNCLCNLFIKNLYNWPSQLKTTFLNCLCNVYIKNLYNWPSQLKTTFLNCLLYVIYIKKNLYNRFKHNFLTVNNSIIKTCTTVLIVSGLRTGWRWTNYIKVFLIPNQSFVKLFLIYIYQFISNCLMGQLQKKVILIYVQFVHKYIIKL